jgi:2-keto-4-pentenoate hydratase
MGKTLPVQAADFSEAQVLDAVSVVCPAMEVCASRLSAPAATALTIADQASHGKLVLGWQYRIPVQQWRQRCAPALADFPVSLRCGDKEVARGDGTAVLNNPSHALTWLANELRRANLQLRAGDFVTTGTMTDLTPVQAGQAWSADFTGLGVVRVSFAEGAPSALSDGDWAELMQQAAPLR